MLTAIRHSIMVLVALVLLGPLIPRLATPSAAASCALYASPKGSSSNSGTLGNRLTPQATANRAMRGDVVCFLGGIYNRR